MINMKKAASIAICIAVTMVASQLPISVEGMAATYNLKIATGNARPHPVLDMADYMKAQLEKLSNGEISVRVYTIGQLGNQQEIIENTRLGAIDICVQVTTNAVPFVKDFQVFNLSYLFSNWDEFRRVVAHGGRVFNHLSREVESGLDSKLLALSGGGARSTSNRIKPIRSPADLKGMKFRVGPAPVVGKQWKTQGAIPVAASFGEIYTAMQTGLVEATEHSISAYNGSKFYEVAPYLALTEHEIMTLLMFASNKRLGRLPAKYQELIIQVGAEAGPIGIASAIKADNSLISGLIKKYNIKVNEVDKSAFKANVVPLHNELAKGMGAGVDALLTTIRTATQ